MNLRGDQTCTTRCYSSRRKSCRFQSALKMTWDYSVPVLFEICSYTAQMQACGLRLQWTSWLIENTPTSRIKCEWSPSAKECFTGFVQNGILEYCLVRTSLYTLNLNYYWLFFEIVCESLHTAYEIINISHRSTLQRYQMTSVSLSIEKIFCMHVISVTWSHSIYVPGCLFLGRHEICTNNYILLQFPK